MQLLSHQIMPLIQQSLQEDIGFCDVTVSGLTDATSSITAKISAREAGTASGLCIVTEVFKSVDRSIDVQIRLEDGDQFNKNSDLAVVQGPVGSILSAERTALNFVSHLCGIATATGRYVQAVKGTKARICCTRKTLPGLRLIQKYAVRCGGGFNHRYSLDGAVLIKDNHIAVFGSIREAVQNTKNNVGHMTPIEVEVDTLDQLKEVADLGVNAILLDNMSLDEMKDAVDFIDGRCLAEASGGITLDNVAEVAATGVDIISVGALTHSVRALDIGLDYITD